MSILHRRTVIAILSSALLQSSSGILANIREQDYAARSTTIFDVKRHGASGSSRNTLGSIARGGSRLRVDAPIDFKNGEGIKLEHAGPGCSLKGLLGCPIGPKPVVTAKGPQGSATYTYQLAVIDEHGGMGPASPAVTVTNGPSVVSTRLYNLIRWEPIPAASGYALYRNSRLLLVLSGLTPEGYYEPPRGPAFTSSFKDMGLLKERIHYPDIPITPPTTALADALVTTVTSGGGTTLLQLKDKASTSVQNTVITHDDSEAIQSTLDASVSGGTVYFPTGSYLFTRSGFSIKRSRVKILGSGNGAILQDNLIGNSFAPLSAPVPCGFISPVDSGDIEISKLGLYGLSPFGSSMTRQKKAICATGSFERLYVHDVLARNISGEAIYADNLKPGEVIFSSNIVEDCAKNALNTNSATLASVTVTDNVVRKVSGAAILVVSQRALVARNKITGGGPIGADVVNVAVSSFFTIAINEITDVDTSLAATSLIHIGFHGSGLNGSGLVVGNVIRDNQTLNETQGGAILLDDVSGPVLIENNLIERNHACNRSGGPALSIANKTDKVLIVDNTIRGSAGDQDIGIRIEKSVPASNHILIRNNDIETRQPTVFKVNPNDGSESEFSELLGMAKSWTRPRLSE